MEHRQHPLPPLPYRVTCAIALGVELDDLIEDEWRTWQVLDPRRAEPPDHAQLWREQRAS